MLNKFDSRWKWNGGFKIDWQRGCTVKTKRKLVKGFFSSGIQRAGRDRDGMGMLAHYQGQPWETWRQYGTT